MRDGAPAKGRLDRLVHNVVDVGRPHDALIVGRDVGEDLVQVHVLLVVRADEVVEGVSCDGEHRLTVAFGIIEAIQ